MTANNLLYCATDKEIYDVLMSAKQKISVPVLQELAKDRGIFYSHKESRETLVHCLSLLTHDYNDLHVILEQREHVGRTEKTTSITLNTELTIDEIKEVAKEYIADSPADEKAVSHQKGTDQYVVNVQYSEVDYSKTRLVQRTPKEAGIEFHVEKDKTIIRIPSNAKAKEIVENLRARLGEKKKIDIPVALIELTEFTSAAERTRFFTLLISSLEEFKLDNVTSVKVEPIKQEIVDDLDIEDDQNEEEAKQDALALIRNVALKGETLLASEEYQSLQKKGFFITSIIWRSKQSSMPFPIVEFEATFDEPAVGKGFKYSVRGALNFSDGEYTKTLRPIEQEIKQKLIALIEKTAINAIAQIRSEAAQEITAGAPAHGG